MRLIDADLFDKELEEYSDRHWDGEFYAAEDIRSMLEDAPIVNPYEWVSVTDRLPEKHQRVLCYHKYEPESPDVICENTYFSGGFWLSDGSKVTHWCSLPAPPTEKEN